MLYPAIEKKSSQALGLSQSLGSFLLMGQSGVASTPGSALNLYEDSSAVSIPINIIAKAFASIDPVIKQNGELIDEHPVLDFISQPSPYFTKILFFENICRDYLITNETEIVAIGNISRPPLQMQPISPKNINMYEGENGYAANIQITGTMLTGTYNPEIKKNQLRYIKDKFTEVKQIRGYSTKNNSVLRGQSPLVSASREARQHIAGNDHNITILEKGGRMSLHFHIKDDLSTDDFTAAKDSIRGSYGGTSGESIAVTSGEDMSVTELGNTNRDMDFAKLQEMAKQAVALTYSVPLPLITVEATTLNNYEVAKTALYDDAVLPVADVLFAGLTNLLMPRFGLDPAKVKITYDPRSITALVTRELDQLKKRREANIETTNELRNEFLAKDDVEGGDVIYQQSSMVALGTDPFAEPEITQTLARDDEDSGK